MASQRELVEQLFEAALALTPRERDAFLDEMCSGDPELKRTVEDLLAEDARAGSFLQHPPLDLLPKGVTAGTRLGQYEIVAPIGAGSMGEVFRARDLRVKREVAIKVLPRWYFSDPDRLRRFQKEAEAIAALNHPNILSLYDVGERDGAPYFVTELLEGETLREKLRSGAFPLAKAVKCAVQIARGLAAAHEKGIVHRDLKPENLFVTKDGRIKILDFGLAKLTQPQLDSDCSGPTETEGTDAGLVMGTPGYMSPEQVRGKTVDHRADIFAFGAILYEMLAGKRAFKRATVAETMTAILNEDPPGISQIVQTAPPGLSRVVHRCLEKDPEQRFQSASDLAFALEALSDSGVSSTAWSRGGTAVARAGSNSARTGPLRWWPRVLISSAALILLVLGLWWLLSKRTQSQKELVQRQLTANSPDNPVLAAAISPDGKFLAYSDANGFHLRLISTGETKQLTLPPGLAVASVFSGAPATLGAPLSWFPDGSKVLITTATQPGEPPSLWAVSILGGAARKLREGAAAASFSPDGSQIAFLAGC